MDRSVNVGVDFYESDIYAPALLEGMYQKVEMDFLERHIGPYISRFIRFWYPAEARREEAWFERGLLRLYHGIY